MIFHKGKIAETYNIGGFNEWKNIDIIKVVIKTVDRLLGRKEGEDIELTLLKQRNQWTKEQISFIQFLRLMEVRFGPRDSGFGLKNVLMQH